MQDLTDIRKKIDEIDSRLLPLFLDRMECSHQVAEYKQANNLPVLDKERESMIIKDRLSKVSDDLKEPVHDFFSNIMRISRNAQTKELSSSPDFSTLLNVFSKEDLKADPVVAYQGVPGANSETALLKFFGPECKKINVMTFGEVFDSIESGKADFGIIPLENSSTGTISASFDLFEKRDFYIVGEVDVNIEHCLVGFPDAQLKDIRKVFSHEQGFMQCKEFFVKYPKMSFEPYHNTAMAAKMIAGLGDPSNAAIADPRTAELYGLKVLANGISSSDINITRFAIVSKKGRLNKDFNKISILFTLPDESGALSRVLSVFASNSLNLTKLESRPSHNQAFQYMFFVDFEGNLLDQNVLNVLKKLSQATASLKILGNYQKA